MSERHNVSIPTAAIRIGTSNATSGRQMGTLDGEHFVFDSRGFTRTATSDAREAILKALYEERSALTRQRRQGGLNTSQAAALADLEAYIDEWQVEEQPSTVRHVWEQLEAIGGKLLAVKAEIERRRV